MEPKRAFGHLILMGRGFAQVNADNYKSPPHPALSPPEAGEDDRRDACPTEALMGEASFF